jgi:predicted regulator of Ras-like GTPase activity (Roadblock/LC7/MglB family)
MFLERLNELSGRIDGALAVSLVAGDGIPIESVSAAADLDIDSIAAELVSLARSISREQRELSVGEVRQFTIAGERMTFLLSRVGGEFWLLAALGPESPLGRARFELRRAALYLEDELV